MPAVIFWIVSTFFLLAIGALMYVGLMLLFFYTVKLIFHMDEAKWTKLFTLKNGAGLYMMLALPYLFMLVIVFYASKVWFGFIQTDFSIVSALVFVALLTFSFLMHMPKLKNVLL